MDEKTSIELSSDEMLILYDLVVRLNTGEALRLDDQGEQRVLWDLESQLEKLLPAVLSPQYGEQLAAARDRAKSVLD